MRIDRQHRPWLVAYVGAAVVAAALFAHARREGAVRPGATAAGLSLGLIAAALVICATLLGARRRLLAWRLGKLSTWLRAHLWIGLASVLFAVLHGGFALGGPLTAALMAALLAAVASGVVGVALQHVLPEALAARSWSDVAEDPKKALGRARRDAYEIVWAASGAPPDDGGESEAIRELLGEAARAPHANALRAMGSASGQGELARFYREVVLPFLRAPGTTRSPLAAASAAALTFDAEAVAIGAAYRGPLDELAALCEVARRARRELELQRWMQAWLLVHIPLSMALLVLLATHAFLALRY